MQAQKYLRNSSGNIAPFFAVALVPLLMAIGVATDYVRYYQVQTVLQAAADSATLAGGATKQFSDAQLQKLATAYMEQNGAPEVVKSISEFQSIRDNANGTFKVVIRGDIPTTFMHLAGIDKLTATGMAEVGLGARALDLVLVFDNTGSMQGTKLQNLKTSAAKLIGILENSKADYAQLQVGIVPFSEYVNVGKQNAGKGWVNGNSPKWNGCVGSRSHPNDTNAKAKGHYPSLDDVVCPAELVPLTEDLNFVRSRINSLVATGATYLPTGLHWGWNVLTNEAPFSEGMSEAEQQMWQGRRVLVLMTDGENTISPNYPKHDGKDVNKSNNLTAESCANIKASGIEVYTISFMIQTPTVQNILDQCATTVERSYNADNSAQLDAAFAEIGKQMAGLRLVK